MPTIKITLIIAISENVKFFFKSSENFQNFVLFGRKIGKAPD